MSTFSGTSNSIALSISSRTISRVHSTAARSGEATQRRIDRFAARVQRRLAATAEASPLDRAGELYDSVHRKLLTLPDDTLVFPGHGAGSACGKNLSSELGFSREHRDLNVLRIGYVASEITKNGGIAICAPIAPYTHTRRGVRELIEPLGGFIEIHVSTPLEICEERDRKGLYALARAGKIKEFTGISDPYETPENPEMDIDTIGISPDLAAHRILVKLESLGFIK